MPYFENKNLKMYYEDVGKGEPIITIHGLMEDVNYWNETGVTARLSEQYRVISIDMRAHGLTVVTEPYGYDADTMAKDFDNLADYLGLERFHLLSHATGGMVAARYAMTRSERLLSLMQTDTGSATRPEMPDMPVDVEPTEEQIQMYRNFMVNTPIEDRMAGTKADPGPFLFKMAEHPNNEEMWKIYEGFLRRQDRSATVDFYTAFYTDPDPRIEQLRQIKCPTLILLGEFDIVFLKPSEIMAKEIPDNRHVILDGIGHMTAIEDPKRTIKEILNFLKTVKQTGKANR
ncbi:MAG: alpha/beta fold hydrolase [Promethearchaeota archaeon]